MSKSHEEYLLEQKEYTKNKIKNRQLTSRSRIANFISFVVEGTKEQFSQEDFKNIRILCIGCRDGTEVDMLKNMGFNNVTGVDLYTNHRDVMEMDMHDLKFNQNSFDLIFACHSLEHGSDPSRYLSEISRCLVSGGLLAFEVPVKFKNNKTISGNVIFDKSPRFAGDVDIIDFENIETFNKCLKESAEIRTEILKHQHKMTPQKPPRAQGNLKAVIRIVKNI